MKIIEKETFFKKIKNYYSSKIMITQFQRNHLLEKLYEQLSDHFYTQYADFRKIYPKSIKRYSQMKLSDLENPLTHDMIINFSKKNNLNKNEHINFCSSLLGMNEKEFVKYEKNRENFEKMF